MEKPFDSNSFSPALIPIGYLSPYVKILLIKEDFGEQTCNCSATVSKLKEHSIAWPEKIFQTETKMAK